MKKKKKNPPTDKDPKVHKSRYKMKFMERIKVLCENFARPETFHSFPTRVLEDMYSLYYPPVRFVAAPGSRIGKEEIHFVKDYFKTAISEVDLDTPTGGKIPLKWFLTDGLLLIHYVQKEVRGG